jgi:6-phosphofructokinase
MPNRKEITTSAETDAFGHVRLGGIGQVVAELIEERLKRETRSVTLGHIQRGGPPSAYDGSWRLGWAWPLAISS